MTRPPFSAALAALLGWACIGAAIYVAWVVLP